MRAATIKKLRKRIKEKGYYEYRLRKFASRGQELKDFYDFECSDFFVGRATASLNRVYYYKRSRKVDARINWYMNKLGMTK